MKKERPGTCKTTKADRRRKLAYFKDAMHRNFGPSKSCGYGPGNPCYCTLCKERAYHATFRHIGDILYCFCDNCLKEIPRLEEEAKGKNDLHRN